MYSDDRGQASGSDDHGGHGFGSGEANSGLGPLIFVIICTS